MICGSMSKRFASSFSDRATSSPSYRNFNALIGPGSTPCRETWRKWHGRKLASDLRPSTGQNQSASFRPGILGAAELLHNVKRNQIVVDLTIDDCTLIIVNGEIGETPSHAYVI